MILEFILACLAIGLMFLFWNNKPPNFPAGPAGLPIIGNLHQLGSEPHKTFMKMREQYGDIFSLKFASYNVIVLNNYKDIKDAFAENAFSGRADFKPLKDRSGGMPRGLIFNVERSWTEQRRFALKSLRDFGFGKKSVETIVYDEITELIDNFRKTIGKPMQTQNKFNAAVLNALWTMVTGNRYSHDDPMLQDLIKRLTSSVTQSRAASVVLFFPWLYQLRNKLTMVFAYAKERQESIAKNMNFVKGTVEDHQSTFQKDAAPRDFIDVYLAEMEKTSDTTSSFYKEEGLKNLTVTLLDLFVAGAETTSTTLSWEFLLLALHADKQEKLHEEIKRVVGLSRLPSLNDRPSMPYTEAVINEVMRFSAMVPLAVFHSALEDVTFKGYQIPKGTLVIPNLFCTMHDPKVWTDPETFRPERFLSEDEKTLVKNEALIPFSTGKRICLGMTLAQDELFLFTSSLFQRFKVGPDPNGEKLTVDYHAASVLVPKPHNLVLYDRIEE
ncbi:Cytochrome P450 2J6 [Orchesella cincta]|uniref:Cytochrome P450 2J6 n=1 Tax=Orchesella cincta TaxID=48709 RepID=A0A1D2MH83_ORCCI|nr:Cytochrome P450 2J6 [Orchesella cincta]